MDKLKKKNNQEKDMLKTYKKQSRNEEIRAHGKQISLRPQVEINKKKYDRKKYKKVEVDEEMLAEIVSKTVKNILKEYYNGQK